MNRACCFFVLLWQLRIPSIFAQMDNSQSYVVTVEKVEVVQVEDGETVIVDFRNVDVIKREHFVNGSIKILEDLDDDNFKFAVDMFISPHGDGDYRKMPMEVAPTGACEAFIKIYAQFVQPSLIFDENTNLPHISDDGPCPIPAGDYYVKEVLLNTDSWPNQFPRGILKFVVKFFKNDVVVGGVIPYLRLEDDTR